MPDTTVFAQSDVAKAREVWGQCRSLLIKLLDPVSVKNWIDPIEPRGYVSNELTLRVPSEQFAMYLEEKFTREFNLVIQYYMDQNTVLLFEFLELPTPSPAEAVAGKDTDTPKTRVESYVSTLNDALRFETFYESDCNRVARSIGESVAIRPGQSPTNLLFIHGPSGVGKTHLVQAIGQRALELHPDLRVCYVSSAKFEAQYIHDSHKDRNAFISFYQQMDLLIIDDIQGLIGKTKTQQAFFEIFNQLYLLNKQIVLTSDIPPILFEGMEERLITRLQSSLMVPLERPDLELRRKILRSKVAESGVQLGEEVMEFIAENAQNNVRELDGTVKTLLTYSQLQQRPIDVHFARTVMSQSISLDRREVSMESIQQVVAREYNIDVSQLRSSTRRADVVLPRQIVMYLTKKHTEHSLGAIAARLGRKNHTTVMHGVRAIEDRMSIDEAFRRSMQQLEQQILKAV